VDRKQTRAFEGFVAESGDTLLRLATLLTSDIHLAEDVYQETLHRLTARWARVANPMAFCPPHPRSRPGCWPGSATTAGVIARWPRW
jgi:predicted RNA polymerase sigma factor